MTEEQFKELKKFIVEVGKILDEKLNVIAFKLDNLQREVEYIESTVGETRDLIQDMDS